MKQTRYTKVLYDWDNPGQCITVECKDHSYAWSGKIPCTGIRRCIHCGKPEQEDRTHGIPATIPELLPGTRHESR
jgi:hypothetical protein